MSKRISSGHGLMLFELIIAIGLFAVFAVVFLRIFLSANQISKKNNELSHAIIAAQNAAECFKADAMPTLYYDESWEPSDEGRAVYRLTLAEVARGDIDSAEIAVLDNNGSEIFTLLVNKLEDADT